VTFEEVQDIVRWQEQDVLQKSPERKEWERRYLTSPLDDVVDASRKEQP